MASHAPWLELVPPYLELAFPSQKPRCLDTVWVLARETALRSAKVSALAFEAPPRAVEPLHAWAGPESEIRWIQAGHVSAHVFFHKQLAQAVEDATGRLRVNVCHPDSATFFHGGGSTAVEFSLPVALESAW